MPPTAWRSQNSASLALCLGALLALSNCSDPAANGDPIRRTTRPHFSAAPIVGTLPGAGQFTTAATASMPTVTYPTVVRIEVDGDIDVFSNVPPDQDVQVATIGPAGGNQHLQTQNCYGMVQIWYSGPAWSYPVGTGCNGGVRTDPILIQGTGSANRGAPYPGSTPGACGPPPYTTPCYYYSGGSQTITLTPVDMQLRLKPSRYVVISGSTVTFQAFGVPDSAAPYKLPFSVQSWQWTPDSGGGSSPACSAGVTTCPKTNMTVSGTMEVTALTNGKSETTRAHVRVLCDTTGNPLLDSLPLLDAMKAAYDSAWNPDHQRRERSWGVKCDDDGVCTTHVDSLLPDAEPCAVTITEDSTLTASGHVHPFIPAHEPGAELVPELLASPRRTDQIQQSTPVPALAWMITRRRR